MIALGIVENNKIIDNQIKIRIPLFESAGIDNKIIYDCNIMNLPGFSPGYQNDDVVYISFLNNNLNEAVVIGKMFKGNEEVNLSSISIDTLKVVNKASLSKFTSFESVDVKQINDMQEEIKFINKKIDDLTNNIGSNVVANPSGDATEVLTKLQVDSTIYSISGSSPTEVKVNSIEVPENNILTDSQSILYESNGTNRVLKLPDSWITYLTNQTFQIPVISLSGTGSKSVEYGVVVSGTLSHYETNIDNINGTLTLYKGGSSVETGITKTTSSTTLTTTINQAITSTVSFQLKCTDTLGNTRTSGTVSYSCYKPTFYGMSQSSTISSVSGLTKKASSSLGTITVTSSAGDYCYFVTSGTINKITSSGFDVPITKQSGTITVNLNGYDVSYNVYRTTGSLIAGSNTFVVS